MTARRNRINRFNPGIDKRELVIVVFLWLPAANDVGVPVEREVMLVAAQPRLGIGRPPYIDAVGKGMIAAIDNRHRATLFAEIHLTIVAHHVEIAVDEQRASSKHAPKGLLSVEVEMAMAIGGSAIKGIVRTFKMAVLVI